jgi:hypothetical protein
MNGNSKEVIFRKAHNALNLAEFWKEHGDMELHKMYADQYNMYMKRYLGVK